MTECLKCGAEMDEMQSACPGCLSEPPLSPASGSVPDCWTYSGYSATLKKNGHFFALVTPDGRNALAPEAAIELIETLTRGSSMPLVLVNIGQGKYRVERMKRGEWPKGSTIQEGLVITLGEGGGVAVEI